MNDKIAKSLKEGFERGYANIAKDRAEVEAEEQAKRERRGMPPPSKIVEWKAFEDPAEDAADYKAHFTGKQKRAELSPEARKAGAGGVVVFIMVLGLVAWFITMLPN